MSLASVPVQRTPLIGHSGARVCLLQYGGHTVVRKMAGRPEQNDRLRGQGEKQTQFRADGVDTPAVLGWGEEDGLVFFDMEFIPAVSLAAEVGDGLALANRRLVDLVDGWITARSGETAGSVPAEALADKMSRVLAASAANRHLGAAAARLPAVANRLADVRWPCLPRSPCHGDFTTENILHGQDGRMILIDFDVPDISSYYFDIAKLYQDLMGLWCLRHMAIADTASLRYRNAQLALRHLRRGIDTLLASRVGDLIADLPALVCLNLMRALPYSIDEAVCQFIFDRVEALLPACRLTPPS